MKFPLPSPIENGQSRKCLVPFARSPDQSHNTKTTSKVISKQLENKTSILSLGWTCSAVILQLLATSSVKLNKLSK